MVCVGIDVAKDKHDCCILDSDGTIRADCITIPNNMDGRIVISGNPQHLAFGGAGINKQVYDLVDGVLIIRAEPEQQFDLQCLIKIIFKLFSLGQPVRFIREERMVLLCFILISLIRLRFWPHLNCTFGSTRIAVCTILYLRFWQSR